MKRKIISILLVVMSLSICIMGCNTKKIVRKSETSKESEEKTELISKDATMLLGV